jgi:dihydrofolate synthase/folylpolyglutamate synthase
MRVISAEAEMRDAQFDWIVPMDMARYIGPAENGLRMGLGRYGEVILPLRGHYQLVNATLATIAAGDMHARLGGVPHASAEYTERIRAGLSAVKWPGRLQKMQDSPAIYLDGTIHAESARSVVESLQDRLTHPIISILSVPKDKDYDGVYAALGPVSDALILTETGRNPILEFLPAEDALAAARVHNADVTHTTNLEGALAIAKSRAGTNGTILILGTQSILADAVLLWDQTYEVI